MKRLSDSKSLSLFDKVINKKLSVSEAARQLGITRKTVYKYLENYKPLIANSTNLKTIASLYGNFIEDWQGQSIKLTVKRIKAFGEFHEAIRVVKEKVTTLDKPEFTPKSPTWNDAKTALKNGSITLEQLLTKYTISDENRKVIQN